MNGIVIGLSKPHLFAAIFVIGLALLFNFTNGFNVAGSQVATVISSRTLSPEIALILVALGDFVGACFLGTSVAQMIGKGIIDTTLIESSQNGILILMSAMIGAIICNLSGWLLGVPSSSSHALIGGLMGGVIAGSGLHAIQWHNVKNILTAMFLAPIVTFIAAYIFTKITFAFAEYLSSKSQPIFKGLQVIALIFQSLAHGTNDAQKAMGIIALTLMIALSGHLATHEQFIVPTWVILSCSISMALGDITGGWKIIRKLGGKLYKIRIIHSFGAQSSSAFTMLFVSTMGFPVSTSQVISASIMGSGAGARIKSVRWGVAGDVVLSWFITIPASGSIAFVAFKLTKILL